MAEPVSITERARLIAFGNERRVYSYTNYVCARRYDRLAVSAIKDEELSGQVEVIRVGPPGADPLIAGNPDGSTVAELRWS